MTAEETEEFRRLVRKHLAERPAVALNARSIHAAVSRELRCTLPEVEDACQLFQGLGHFHQLHNSFGSVKYFQITAHGTLAHERGE